MCLIISGMSVPGNVGVDSYSPPINELIIFSRNASHLGTLASVLSSQQLAPDLTASLVPPIRVDLDQVVLEYESRTGGMQFQATVGPI